MVTVGREGKGKGQPRPARATLGVSGVTEGVGEGRGAAASTLPAIWVRGRPGRCRAGSAWRRTARAGSPLPRRGPAPGARVDGGVCTRATRHHWAPGTHPGTVGEGAGCRASAVSGALGGGLSAPRPASGSPRPPARAIGAGGGPLAPAGVLGLGLMLPFLFQWEASV